MHNPLSAVGTERASRLAALAVCVVAVLIGLWLLVRLVWLLVPRSDNAASIEPAALGITPATAAGSIAQWHIFGNSQSIDLAARALNAPRTALKLTLRGTLALVDPKEGIAMIADEQNVERSYKIGDSVGGSAKLAEVYADHVVLSHDGVAENLNLPSPQDRAFAATVPGGAARAPGTAASSVPPGYTAGSTMTATSAPPAGAGNVLARSNAADLLRQVQFEPVFAGGRISGARLSGSGAAGTLMAQVGLRPTDVVTSVNGTDLSSVSSPQQLLDKLGNASSLQVTVQRDGKPATLTLNLR
jgi:general secretion pathway protein C